MTASVIDEMCENLALVYRRNMYEERVVEQLCEQLGYGRVMQIASNLWREKDSAGAFVIGPCAVLVEPCAHQVKNIFGHCEICCGCGWATKFVAQNMHKELGDEE